MGIDPRRRALLAGLLAASLLPACTRRAHDQRTLVRVTAVTAPGTPWYAMWESFA
jgi:hypothetical protein